MVKIASPRFTDGVERAGHQDSVIIAGQVQRPVQSLIHLLLHHHLACIALLQKRGQHFR